VVYLSNPKVVLTPGDIMSGISLWSICSCFVGEETALLS